MSSARGAATFSSLHGNPSIPALYNGTTVYRAALRPWSCLLACYAAQHLAGRQETPPMGDDTLRISPHLHDRKAGALHICTMARFAAPVLCCFATVRRCPTWRPAAYGVRNSSEQARHRG